MNQIASQPQAARDIAYFKANIGNIKSVDDFMNNTKIYNFVMQAYVLSDMTYAKAFIKKALTEGVDSSDAFAVKLSDPRFKALVSAFNFARNGASTTSDATLQQTTVDKYLENQLETQAGQQSDGLRLALYFKANIASVSTNYGILADKALYEVVRTTLGMPAAMSSVDIDKQATIIGQKFSLNDMQDPKKLDSFVKRFLAMYDMQNNTSSQSNPAVQIMAGSTTGIDMNTILSLQSLKRFGS